MAQIPTQDALPYLTGNTAMPLGQRDAEPSRDSEMMSYIYGKVKYFHTHKKAKLVYYEDVHKARHYEIVNKKGLIIAEVILPVREIHRLMMEVTTDYYVKQLYLYDKLIADEVIKRLNEKIKARKTGGIIEINKEEYRKKYFEKYKRGLK